MKTKQRILDAGLALAKAGEAITIARVGAAVGVTHSGVLYHYKTAKAMRDAVAEHAVASRCAPVIARLIIDQHPAVSSLSAADRAGWMAQAAG